MNNVNIRKTGIGYVIEISDNYIKDNLAITREELEKIVLYGQMVLNTIPDVNESCEMCKLVDRIPIRKSYCSKHNYEKE